jgi:hypothetical protein
VTAPIPRRSEPRTRKQRLAVDALEKLHAAGRKWVSAGEIVCAVEPRPDGYVDGTYLSQSLAALTRDGVVERHKEWESPLWFYRLSRPGSGR